MPQGLSAIHSSNTGRMDNRGFILSALEEADIYWLQTAGTTDEVPAGTVLIAEGSPVHTFYILLVGTLTVSLEAMDGREIARLGSGEVLGEMSFIDDRPSAATVRAAEPSLVLAIPQRRLALKLEQDEKFASRFYRAIARFLSGRLRSTFVQFGYWGEQLPGTPVIPLRSMPETEGDPGDT